MHSVSYSLSSISASRLFLIRLPLLLHFCFPPFPLSLPPSSLSLNPLPNPPPSLHLPPSLSPQETIQGAINTKMIKSTDEIVSIYYRRLEHGYPTPSLDRDNVLAEALPMLKKQVRNC